MKHHEASNFQKLFIIFTRKHAGNWEVVQSPYGDEDTKNMYEEGKCKYADHYIKFATKKLVGLIKED